MIARSPPFLFAASSTDDVVRSPVCNNIHQPIASACETNRRRTPAAWG